MRSLIILAISTGMFMCEAAYAQNTAFQVEQFEPLPAQNTNLGNLASSTPLGHLEPSFGLTLNFADDPIQLRADGVVAAKLVDDQLKAELAAAVGLFDIGDIGLVIPTVLVQTSELSTSYGEVGSGPALADLRVIPRVRVLNSEKAAGFGIGLLLPFYIPIGDTSSFNSDGAVRLEPRVAVDWSHPLGIRAIVNLGYQLRTERAAVNYVNDDALRFGAGVEAPTGLDWLSASARLFGSFGLADGRDPEDLSVSASNAEAQPLEADVGLRARFGGTLLAHASIGAGLTSDVGSPDFRVVGGVEWTPVLRHDADGDGIEDEADACPREPEDLDGFLDEDGCAERDNDGDQLPDNLDNCPNEEEDVDGFQDLDGCPDPDNDNDGLLDNDDQCPEAAGVPATHGCPPEDNDNDGVADHLEECPDAPEDLDGFQDEDGCPDPDNDHDGIRDDLDLCPGEAEIVNGRDDTDGCPDKGATFVRVTEESIETTEPIVFGSGASVRNRSRRVLNHVAIALQNHTAITKLKVAVAPLTEGGAGEKLAARRAKAISDYLGRRGVIAERLEAVTLPFDAEKAAGGDLVRLVITETQPLILPAPEPAPDEGGDTDGPEEPQSAEGFDFGGGE